MCSLVPVERIEKRIYLLRGQKVMLDRALANLYGVSPKVLNQAVKRNIERFPDDFMFQLNNEELVQMRRIESSEKIHGQHRKYVAYAFTEQGVAMLSSVLKSKRAVQVNVEIMRAFVKLREMLTSHKDLARKLNALEKKYDAQFRVVFDAIREMMISPKVRKRNVGFRVGDKK